MTGVRHVLPTLDEANGLGASLTAIDDRLLRQVPGKKRRWWKGSEPYLAVTVDHAVAGAGNGEHGNDSEDGNDEDGNDDDDDDDDGACVFVEVCFRGRFARRRGGGPLETGVTDELDISRGMPGSRGEQLENERPDVVALARAILEGAGLILESAWLAAP